VAALPRCRVAALPRCRVAALLVAALLVAATPIFSQTRRPKRPAPTPTKSAPQVTFKDIGRGFLGMKPNRITLDHSLEGRDYYIHYVAYKAETDEVIVTLSDYV
ncbi:MAG: hypothetical protein AABN95_24805, partial [Acidobacteriota bacterium]